MSTFLQLHEDPLAREELIRGYLKRSLDTATIEAFESHYLTCRECFEELRTTDLLMQGLARAAVNRRTREGVVVIEFTGPAQLTRQSAMTRELQGIMHQGDSKVLIDMSKVSRIDSAGLGLLMQLYSHALRNRGILKVLKPSQQVQHVMHVAKVDSVVEAYDDEGLALRSFAN